MMIFSSRLLKDLFMQVKALQVTAQKFPVSAAVGAGNDRFALGRNAATDAILIQFESQNDSILCKVGT